MLSFLNDIDNFFCRLEGKKKHTTLNGAIQKPTDARSNTIQQPKVNKQILKENAKKIGLGSILYNLFVSKEYKDQGLDGWREDKEKFKVDLINDIKTFLFTKWEKPWKAGLVFDDNGKILSGFRNMSGRVYKNESNVMSLSSKSGNSPFFVTLNKLNKLGGKIIDKLKTVWVISYIPIYKDVKLNGKDDNQDRSPDFMLPKFHQVINVDFVEGIEKPKYKTVEFKKLELNEYVENFVNELKRLRRLPKLYYDQSDRCFYKRSLLTWDNESIHLVPINSFKNIEGYYSTLFHEITHSTMNPKRCGRGKFKDASLAYANEELVAEMGAMIICEELGLKYQRQNSLSYLNGWLKQAKGSDIDSALIEAYAYACDAADYLLEGINLDKLVPKTLAKRAGEQDKKSETGADLSKNTKSKSESKLQPKAWEQTKEEYVKQYRIKINEEYRSTGWKRQSEASKKRVNKLQQDKAQALRVHKEVVAKEFAKGTEIPTNVLRDYPELKLSEIDKTIEQLIANAEPFRTVKLTDVSYGKDFKDGYVNTPIGRVRIDKVQIRKLIRKARVEFFGLIKPTLEKPLIIVTSKDNNGNEREAFIKTFTDGKTIFFVSFVKTDENLVLVSNHPRREGQIKKILSEGNITYPQDSITALSGLPNITEPRYKTLLIGLRLKSLSKDKQKTSQSQAKPKPKQQTLTNPIDIFIHKAGSTFRGIPAAEIKALLGALERFKKTDEWDKFKEDGILDLLEFTESEEQTLGIPENYDSKKQPKTSLLTTNNYFGDLKLSEVGEAIFAAYEKFVSKKANLKPVNTGQLMLFGVKARKNEFWTEIHGEIKLVEMLENGMITWDDFTKGKCTGIRAKSELFKTKKEAINYFKPKPLNGIDEVNTQFNHELNLLIKGKLPNNHIFRLGMPSNALLNAGLDNLSIEMPASTLLVKSSSEYKSNHPFSLTDIANLPSAIAAPIAVFEAELDPIRKVVLTELKDERKVNFICILDLFEKRAYGKQAIIVNSIISLYPKSSAVHIAKWFLGRECEEIGRDLLLWVDKEKALKWSSGHSSYVNAAKLSSKRIANIIQNFKNPTSTPNNLNGETKNLLGLQPISSTRKGKTYRIKGDLGQFLGEYDRNNYTIVLRGDKGAGKSRLLYQLINAFAGKQLRVAFLSLEMAKNSSITQRYKNEYISKANLKRIDITDQAPTYDDLNTICKDYDVVGIDSWTKLKGITQLDFDRLQKDNPNTIIICIFQSTTGKVTRGGNMPEYDAGTVIQVNKGGLAECEKNRYATTDMIYNVFTKSLEQQEEEQKPND